MGITELALGEIERLADKGITLSPDEIVTLNNFAIDAMNSKHGFSMLCAERRVRFGAICFREPTFAHLRFIDQCKDIVDLDGESGVVFRAFTVSMDAKNLPDLNNEDLVKSQFVQFQTMIQYVQPRVISMIVGYLFVGPDYLPSLSDSEDKDYMHERDWVLQEVVSGASYDVGLNLEQIMSLRPIVLKSLLYQTIMRRDAIKMNGSTGKFFKYSSMLEEKHTKEKDEVK